MDKDSENLLKEVDKDSENLLKEDDFKLIDRFLLGDIKAFDIILNRYKKKIYFMIFRVVQNHTDTDELTQKTFIKIYKNLSKFKKTSKFSTWIYSIVNNMLKNYYRNKQNFLPLENFSNLKENPKPLGELINREEKSKIFQAISLLPEKQRLVINFRIYEELSFKEIAQIMNSSEENVKANFHHAVNKLKEIFISERE